MRNWNKKQADEVERMLLKILAQSDWAINGHGCSLENRDYKVHFQLKDENPNKGFFIEYDPEMQAFECWAAGLGYKFPRWGMDRILKDLFPRINHSDKRGPGVDGFHLWRLVSLEELRKATTKL